MMSTPEKTAEACRRGPKIGPSSAPSASSGRRVDVATAIGAPGRTARRTSPSVLLTRHGSSRTRAKPFFRASDQRRLPSVAAVHPREVMLAHIGPVVWPAMHRSRESFACSGGPVLAARLLRSAPSLMASTRLARWLVPTKSHCMMPSRNGPRAMVVQPFGAVSVSSSWRVPAVKGKGSARSRMANTRSAQQSTQEASGLPGGKPQQGLPSVGIIKPCSHCLMLNHRCAGVNRRRAGASASFGWAGLAARSQGYAHLRMVRMRSGPCPETS
mmetsp:Transcript_104478/g.276893  ORF Transcript_104478/g.276893 Transcript_104478/m.276893 type:complete len:271 (+) Transcript_104478:292-1104(+)